MSHRVFFTVSMCMALLASVPAGAQEIPCSEGPCLRPSRPGTHFIAEVNGGGSFAGGVGPAVGGVLGVGGKLRGFPLRFYLITEFAYASNAQEGTLHSRAVGFREERSFRDIAAGLRIYVPFGRLRLFVDAMGGGSHTQAFLERDGLSPLSASDWSGMGLVGGGLQLRLIHHLSIGVRCKAFFSGDDLDDLRDMERIDDPVRTSATMGLTWHF
jgi:hypothetical protein